MVIGLTGGIGSGKSTVANFLKELGAGVIDADAVGHQVYEPHTEGWREVVAEFGEGILQPDGKIDRKRLGEVVFRNPQAIARLNQILHPKMYQAFQKEIQGFKNRGFKAVVLDAAILFEAHWEPLVNEVWVVTVPEEVAVRRTVARSGLKEAQVRDRIRSQMPPEEKAQKAEVVIDTNCSLEEVRQKVLRLWEQRVEA